jgi:Fic family protein
MKKIEQAPNFNLWLKRTGISKVQSWLYNPKVGALADDLNESYKYWDKAKYMEAPDNMTAEDIWMLAKIKRALTPYRISVGTYTFSWYLNSQLNELLHSFDLNIGGNLGVNSLIPKEDKHKYLVNSIMEEAIASSQIEGAVTSRRMAKEMLRKNIPPKNKSEQMIYNNYQTIRKILEIKDEPLAEKNLLEIHLLIAKDTMFKAEEGALRTTNDVHVVDVTDGTVVHTPPRAEILPALMQEFYHFFNNESEAPFIHPIVKACIIHFLIGFIHPFADGNGRTARALFYWYLLRKGYWLTEYMSISRLILRSKAQYARAYQYSEIYENDLTYFIKYQLRTMKLAFDDLREYIKRKIAEKIQLADLIRIRGINERQALIVKWYYEEPNTSMNVREVQTRLGVSNQTARNDLNHLKTMGFLQAIAVNKKSESFIRTKDFENLLEKSKEGL